MGEKWVRTNDPRRRPDGARVSLTLSEEEAGLLANYFVSRWARAGPGPIDDGKLALAASIGLPWNPTGAYLNAQLGLEVTDGRPRWRRPASVACPCRPVWPRRWWGVPWTA